DLVRGVVVDDAGAHDTVDEPEPGPEPGGDLDRVEVAPADGDVATPERPRDLMRPVPADGEGERRDAAVHRARPIQPARGGKPGEEALPERALVPLDRSPADRVEVADGGDEAGEQLVGERPGLVAAARRRLGRGADLVRPPALEQLAPGESEAEVR